MEKYTACVWPRLEPFLIGVLPAAPPSKFSMHYLRKMACYVRSRDGCFPRLGWHMWRHIACGKLQLAEELAWLYFETFDLLMPHSAERRLEWAEALSQCHTPKELDRLRGKLSVDTQQFLLFLYLQQLNRISLRTSLIGEEWPSPRSRSPSSSSERETKISSQNKNWENQAHLTFIHTHLPELLELLVEPGQLSGSGQILRDSQLTPEALESLSLLLEGSASPGRTVHPIHKLLSRAPLQAQAGFSKLNRTYSLQQFQGFLHKTLCLNPFGISICPQSVEGILKKAKIFRNSHTAPPGSRLVLMSQVCKQTLAKDSEKLNNVNVKLHRCSDAFIYLLSPLRSVTLDKCRNTTVVLGPVGTSVHIQSCENVRVVCAAGRLTVGTSFQCTIHTLTPTRPLLLPGNVSLTLGPFHTHYPSLEDHMASVGLAVVPNLWDQPLLFGAEGSAPDTSCYRILPPSEFYPLVIPFQMEGDNCEIPWSLPEEYQKAVESREQTVQEWQKTVKDAHLNKVQRRQFQALVEQKFHEWLLETGQRQELDSLLPPTLTPSSSVDHWPSSHTLNSALHPMKDQPPQQAIGQTPTVC
ncbi:TBCC domain-containing protein 1 isoform X1 [Triplophysa rosa]|uniref:TBCC domain-containing protein 1 isoform X1 n=1 Tax=Triplophysa rosa TaxID=992332 RepID=UPI00254627BA|nr:TBCC domain-containing protein 1 isoform X1 [Triplophysa rosa]XP_057191728.1 TBCC domain-containing protein 1 isoform X1 [Triplophysa rosa]